MTGTYPIFYNLRCGCLFPSKRGIWNRCGGSCCSYGSTDFLLKQYFQVTTTEAVIIAITIKSTTIMIMLNIIGSSCIPPCSVTKTKIRIHSNAFHSDEICQQNTNSNLTQNDTMPKFFWILIILSNSEVSFYVTRHTKSIISYLLLANYLACDKI